MFMLQAFLSTRSPELVGFGETDILSGIFKVLFILSIFFYIVFAVIVIRQVQIMKNTLITPVSPLILFLSILHLLMAVGILLLFLIIL